MLAKIEVGNIVEGKVVKIKPFGAIVSLPDNSHGLVHISQVSTGFVQNVTDILKIGDTVKVKVLSIDDVNKKISLSIKDTMPAPERPPRKESYQRNSNHNNNSHNAHAQTSAQPLDPKEIFENKFKDWQKEANDRQAGLNKRNKRR